MSKQPIVVILGGGAGKGFFPLTKNRSKAAVPFGGKYRLVDITISNCLHSEFYKIFVLTQHKSGSLNRHIVQSFQISSFLDGFVDVRAASLTPNNPNWYQGTADAVRQNMRVIREAAEISGSKQVLILSGDHLYRMNYQRLYDFHLQKNAEVTLSLYPVDRQRATSLGVVQIDDNRKLTRFVEKPPYEKLDELISNPDDPSRAFLGSMGIYLFELSLLDEILHKFPEFNEFGRDVLPYLIDKYNLFGYEFQGYWENVGTIRSFYDAMLNTSLPHPNVELSDEITPGDHPFFSRGRSLPPAKINGAHIEESILAEGSIIDEGTTIKESIIGMRALVSQNVHIEKSLLFGCDYYESIEERNKKLSQGDVPLGIGENCIIKNCIIDKNARIGKNVRLENREGIQHKDSEKYYIRDGIIIVPKDTVIEDNFSI